jgi:hypothetical protein
LIPSKRGDFFVRIRSKIYFSYYDDIPLIIDQPGGLIFAEDQIMVELKASIKLEDFPLAQAMNYCLAYTLPVGLLRA